MEKEAEEAGERELERAEEEERRSDRSPISFSFSSRVFFLFVSLSPAISFPPPPSFPRYALASGETHTCSYVTVMALSRCEHAQF